LRKYYSAVRPSHWHVESVGPRIEWPPNAGGTPLTPAVWLARSGVGNLFWTVVFAGAVVGSHNAGGWYRTTFLVIGNSSWPALLSYGGNRFFSMLRGQRPPRSLLPMFLVLTLMFAMKIVLLAVAGLVLLIDYTKADSYEAWALLLAVIAGFILNVLLWAVYTRMRRGLAPDGLDSPLWWHYRATFVLVIAASTLVLVGIHHHVAPAKALGTTAKNAGPTTTPGPQLNFRAFTPFPR
jgi:hypothetical protein